MAKGQATSEQAAGAAIAAPGPLIVSRFEALLVRMLRSFLQATAGDAAAEKPVGAAGKLSVPRELSPACVHLVADALSKGCVQYLARAGGWRRERHLRLGHAMQGRLWERTPVPELGLAFSQHSLRFLVWLTAGRRDKENLWAPPADELTTADQFLLFLAYEGLRGTDSALALRGSPYFYRHGLIRLFFAEDFVPAPAEIDAGMWTSDVGASIMEALQPMLQRCVLDVERGKNQIGDWAKLRAIGQSQEQALTAFLNSCQAARRPDLARFLLKAMADLLTRDLTPQFWLGGLQSATMPPRLADRLAVQRSALTVLRQVEHLANWTRQARATSFLDENYATAQLWLSDWEQYRGDEIAVIAQQLLRQLEPLRTQAPAPIDAGPSATPEKATPVR